MQPDKTRRLFFALWPDDIVRKKIAELFKQIPGFKQAGVSQAGHPFKVNNLHLTLYFLGNVTEQQFECVQDKAESVKAQSFKLSLDTFGSFTRAHVFWTGPTHWPDELDQLHINLNSAMTGCGFSAEKRAFTPHVTLMRKMKRKIEPVKHAAIEWQINQFALIESIQAGGGVEYKPLQIYHL